MPDAAQVAGVWTDSNYYSRTGALTVSTVKNAAALSEVARVDHQGGTFRSVRLNPASETKPTCDDTHRGRLWQTYGGAGVKDSLEVCAKDVSDAYAWRALY